LVRPRPADELERSVRPVAVVIVDVGVEHALEVSSAEEQDPVETFTSDGADEALGVGVRLRRAYRCADHLDPFAPEDLVEDGGVLAVAITNQETDRYRALGQRPRELAGLLDYLAAVGVGGAAGKVHASSAELDEEEHVQASEPERVDGEEVAGDDSRCLCTHELAPGKPASFARDADPTPVAACAPSLPRSTSPGP
jgi:hypothetical protein